MTELKQEDTFQFCERALSFEYGYGGVIAAIAALSQIPDSRSAYILRQFIEKKGKEGNGQAIELCEMAGRALGSICAIIQKSLG